MNISSNLISELVKVTNDKTEPKKESTVYGTVKEYDGSTFVQIDGSDMLTPISDKSTSALSDGERVIVTIKNHTAIVTGNLSSPSARWVTDEEGKKSVEGLDIEGVLGELVDQRVIFKEITVDNATIKDTLYAENGVVNTLNAHVIKVDELEVAYGEFVQLVAEDIQAINGTFESLGAKYANIDFSNIGKAAMEYFYSVSGLIEDVTVGDGTITGKLVGVTIKGDVIEGNTIVADKLVIQGEDGLYYKLNLNGVAPGTVIDDYANTGIEIDAVEGTLLDGVLTTTGDKVYQYTDSSGNLAYYCVVITTYYAVQKSTVEIEQTDYNSINGSIITAKSITATQISVDDLVAFDATIGGFTITDDSIYSNVKDSEGNTTRGTYIGADGEVNFGDGKRFIKYYLDTDGTWKLAISADTILYDVNGSPHSLADLGAIGEYVSIGTYEGEPCIELGETDSDFKLLITNTRMLFMEGTEIVAHVSNQSLHIKKAVIEEELQQGNFVWKVRANGNIGLMWKGDA